MWRIEIEIHFDVESQLNSKPKNQVNCDLCGIAIQKKNLATHKKRVHSDKPKFAYHEGVVVDMSRGVYLIREHLKGNAFWYKRDFDVLKIRFIFYYIGKFLYSISIFLHFVTLHTLIYFVLLIFFVKELCYKNLIKLFFFDFITNRLFTDNQICNTNLIWCVWPLGSIHRNY